MASLISKRQQARNEKALQDLMQSVPGNKMCADCGARNPGWASWSLGIFLCMRCASIHRKLGTHISKVKSLTMDGWTNDQVDNMKRVGNAASNKIYNPQNKKPPVPIDADEADSAMERFIRSKYAQVATGNTSTGKSSTRRRADSDEGTPPPLPPKTGTKFFKSGSIFRSKKSSENQHAPRSPTLDLRNKPSKVFGASVHHDAVDDTVEKLAQLREMGFADDKRNTMVLKGVNGNLEKTVEALIRLGEGGGVSPLAQRETFPPQTSHSLTPVPRTPTASSMSKLSPAASPGSNNPWDLPPPAQPQSSQSTGTLPSKNPFLSTNPFGMPAQQAEFALNQSLQNLSLASTPQPQQLFPHHTGGIPASQPIQQPLYQQSMTPQTHNFASMAFDTSQTYPQPFQPAQNSYNPFLQTPGPQQQNMAATTSNAQNQGAFANNPFTRSPTRLTSPALGQIPEQAQQNFYDSPQSLYGNNPFLAMTQPTQQMSYAQPQQQQQQQPQFQVQQQQQQQPQFQVQQQQQPQGFDQMFYQTQQPQQPQQQPMPQVQPQWRDKASIMALYNLAPAPTQQAQDQVPQSATLAPTPGTQSGPQQNQPQRSVSTPLPGNNNPFFNGSMGAAPTASYGAATPNPISGGSAKSRDSMTLGMEMAWNNGRHSPDAFASLSSRTG